MDRILLGVGALLGGWLTEKAYLSYLTEIFTTEKLEKECIWEPSPVLQLWVETDLGEGAWPVDGLNDVRKVTRLFRFQLTS